MKDNNIICLISVLFFSNYKVNFINCDQVKSSIVPRNSECR